MRNAKALGLALLAVLALGAVTAGAVQGRAPRWTAGGKTICSMETATLTGGTTGTPVLYVRG